MSTSINQTIETIVRQSQAEADKRRDEIVKRKLANASASERKAEFWGKATVWGLTVQVLALLVLLACLLVSL